jgi:hypothetical protein
MTDEQKPIDTATDLNARFRSLTGNTTTLPTAGADRASINAALRRIAGGADEADEGEQPTHRNDRKE